MIMDTDVYVNVFFVDSPVKTNTERTFMINGKAEKLEGLYEDGTIGITDIGGVTYSMETTFFIAKRSTNHYTYPQHQAGFLCAAALDSKYSSFNIISSLFASNQIATETFMIKTSATKYSKYEGQLLAGFDP
jgi:hypothetical protein